VKVATITLNPAIDQTVLVDSFRPNAVNRGQAMEFAAGGKGVNVASVLADYGCEAAVTGFLGRDNLTHFERLFAEKRIDDHFVRIPGRTRTNVKIVDVENQQTTDVNMPGLTPEAEAFDALLQKVNCLAEVCDWFVLSGNLPPDVSPAIYATLIAALKKRGRQVALDTSRDALRHGLAAGPTIVKPNIHELEEIVGQPLRDAISVAQAARGLLAHSLQLVVVSMGEKGALLVSRQSTLIAVPPPVRIRSTTGAGDAMVAGLVAGMRRGLSLPECARLATSFSIAILTRAGHEPLSRGVLEQNISQVSVHTLE
jgi:1-phosphofructokinase